MSMYASYICMCVCACASACGCELVFDITAKAAQFGINFDKFEIGKQVTVLLALSFYFSIVLMQSIHRVYILVVLLQGNIVTPG